MPFIALFGRGVWLIGKWRREEWRGGWRFVGCGGLGFPGCRTFSGSAEIVGAFQEKSQS